MKIIFTKRFGLIKSRHDHHDIVDIAEQHSTSRKQILGLGESGIASKLNYIHIKFQAELFLAEMYVSIKVSIIELKKCNMFRVFCGDFQLFVKYILS